MKPFDLEAAKRGEPIQTSGGAPVTFIAHIPDALVDSRVVVFLPDTKELLAVCEDGSWLPGHDSFANCLSMAPRKQDVWVNLYLDGTATHHISQEYADGHHRNGCRTSRFGGRAWRLEIEE